MACVYFWGLSLLAHMQLANTMLHRHNNNMEQNDTDTLAFRWVKNQKNNGAVAIQVEKLQKKQVYLWKKGNT